MSDNMAAAGYGALLLATILAFIARILNGRAGEARA